VTRFVLVHSPHGGSYTWEPVGDMLRSRGHHVAIPTFPTTATGAYWERNVNAILRMVQRPSPVIVGHSGAGPLLALVARWSESVRCVYVDAGFRKDAGVHPKLPLVERGTGVVPAWANDADLAGLIPDAATRQRLIQSIAPFPREYFAEGIPYRDPPDRSVYLLLSRSYADVAATARARGWTVREVSTANHYAMLAEPERLADELLEVRA